MGGGGRGARERRRREHAEVAAPALMQPAEHGMARLVCTLARFAMRRAPAACCVYLKAPAKRSTCFTGCLLRGPARACAPAITTRPLPRASLLARHPGGAELLNGLSKGWCSRYGAASGAPGARKAPAELCLPAACKLMARRAPECPANVPLLICCLKRKQAMPCRLAFMHMRNYAFSARLNVSGACCRLLQGLSGATLKSMRMQAV